MVDSIVVLYHFGVGIGRVVNWNRYMNRQIYEQGKYMEDSFQYGFVRKSNKALI